MLEMSNDLVNFISQELEERGWSMRELARRAGLSPTTISDVINGSARPGLEFYRGVSRAFQVPLDDVLRIAKVLPSLPPETARTVEANRLFAQLTDEEQEILLAQLRGLVERRRVTNRPAHQTD